MGLKKTFPNLNKSNYAEKIARPQQIPKVGHLKNKLFSYISWNRFSRRFLL